MTKADATRRLWLFHRQGGALGPVLGQVLGQMHFGGMLGRRAACHVGVNTPLRWDILVR